jgi:outer membrane immunogenic protein
MKKLWLCGVALATLASGSAFAADMPLKAPPPPVEEWTGFYIDVGVGWASENLTWQYITPGIAATLAPFPMREDAGFLAGHLGYQQQFGWLVVGGEWGAASPFTDNFATAASVPGATCTLGALVTCNARIGDTWTAGGKLGVAWNNWLVYGVGGYARTTLATELTTPGGGVAASPALLTVIDAGSRTATGWYGGGGFDYMFLTNRLVDMIIGVEYEHFDFGNGIVVGSGVTIPALLATKNVAATEDAVFAKFTVKINPWK